MSAGEQMLRHPNVPKPERVRVVYEAPILDAGTAASREVAKFLRTVARKFIHLFRIDQLGLKAAEIVMVVGDQQTYERMRTLKLHHPLQYSWLVILPGEFHFCMHALMALHKLWFSVFGALAVAHLKCQRSIKADWTSIEACKYYDHFWQLMILSLALYLKEVVPAPVLSRPEHLRQQVGQNVAAAHAVRFLYEFGFPWLALRQAIRANNAHVIDVMWRVCYHWFAATNKYHYRILCVVVTCTTAALRPELLAVWVLMRTGSLSGHPGRNVAWDFFAERFNKVCKQTLGFNVTRERLKQYIPIINAFQHMWSRFLSATGRSQRGDNLSDYSHISDEDLAEMLAFWRKTLGASYGALCARRRKYAFGGNGTPPDPWDVVLKQANGTSFGNEYVNSDSDDDDEDDNDDDDAGDGSSDDGSSSSSSSSGEVEWEVDRILKTQVRPTGKRWYYVKWKKVADAGGETYVERTWEPEKNLTNCQQAIDAFKQRQEDDDDGEDEEGDDPDEDYDVKTARWYRDVSDILRFKTPLL